MFKALARLWRYLVALVTGKVAQMEDPEVLLEQAKREMHEALARNRERAIQAITQKNLLQAEVELFFAHLDDRSFEGDLFDPAEFLNMVRTMGLYDVGRMPDGTPLQPPEHMLQAERQAAEPA